MKLEPSPFPASHRSDESVSAAAPPSAADALSRPDVLDHLAPSLTFTDRVRLAAVNRALRASPVLRADAQRGRAVQTYHRAVSDFVAAHARDLGCDRAELGPICKLLLLASGARCKAENVALVDGLTRHARTVPPGEPRIVALHSLMSAAATLRRERRAPLLRGVIDDMRATPLTPIARYDREARIFAEVARREEFALDFQLKALENACETAAALPAGARAWAMRDLHARAPRHRPTGLRYADHASRPTRMFTERIRRRNHRLPTADRAALPAPDPGYDSDVEMHGYATP